MGIPFEGVLLGKRGGFWVCFCDVKNFIDSARLLTRAENKK